jgi:hypothetical protein
MRRIFMCVIAAFLAVVMSVTVQEGYALADANGQVVTSQEVREALKDVPDLLAQSSSVKNLADSDSLIDGTVSSTDVDVPRDANDGVALKLPEGSALRIGLPHAAENGAGKLVVPGVVAYAGADGAANAVQAGADGGVRALIVIDSPTADTRYSYEVNVPNGGRLKLVDGGGVAIVDRKRRPIGVVSAPWTRDANGVAISTRFEISGDGRTLTQVVDHKLVNAAYPVTADPSFWGYLKNYVECVFGVGAPIGIAIAILMYPPSWNSLGRISTSLSASGRAGSPLDWYVKKVRKSCKRYLHP